MNNRRLRNGGRKKALFGESMAAAGIMAAATMAAAGIGANAAKNSAKQQADATVKAAKQNADALKAQNENSNKLQQQNIDFTKEQNEQNRQLQRDVQMTLQTMAGQESFNDRKEASKIQVRNGGVRANRRHSLLRGSNIPFTVTDGGSVIPVGITPEGFDLYEIQGNDHEHYHKTRGGKNKTGVGIKFAGGEVVEGEGNQNSNNGELLMTTPGGAYFISKHYIKGFNPAKAVKQGMNPMDAFAMQENIKDMNGISDDGRPVGRYGRHTKLAGGDIQLINANLPQGFDFSSDTMLPSAIGIAYGMQNQENDNQAKCGKRVRRLRCGGRHKAYGGTRYIPGQGFVSTDPSFDTTAVGASTGTSSGGGFKNWANNNAQFIGAGIGALGNIGGALISTWGNNAASDILSDAYAQSSGIMADAYRNMKGIDLSQIAKENYAAAHVMPAIRSAFYNINPQLAAVERSRDRLRSMTRRNSLSSAAMLNRLGKIEVDAADQRNSLYGEKANQEERIKQANNEAINKAAVANAQLDIEANKQWASDYMKGLMYNADIENARITKSAEALSNGMNMGANAQANAATANSGAWANAISQSSLGFANTMAAAGKQREDMKNVMLGASNDSYYRYLMMNGSKSEKAAAVKQLEKLSAASSGKTKEQYDIWKNMLLS